MYRATIEITKINSMMKIKFGIIISSDEDKKYLGNQSNKLISKFNDNGNDYLRINPHPFIVIDISSMNKNEGWNANMSVSLNRMGQYKFVQSLKKFIRDFSNYKNLFYYENNKLIVNQSVVNEVSMNISTNSKIIRLQPCVVPDEENQELVYEGAILFINNMQNYAYLTYDELNYLLWEIERIDMTVLSLEILDIVKLYYDEKTDKVIVPPSVERPVEIEKITPGRITFVRPDERIPKI